jgi:hypothetical protein
MEIPIIGALLIGAVAIGLCVWVMILDTKLEQLQGYAKRLERANTLLDQQLAAAKRHAAFEQEKIIRRNHDRA